VWPGPNCLEVLAVLKRDAKAQLGLDLQEIKTEYHAPTGAAGDVPPGVKEGSNVGTTAGRAGVVGRGLVIAGTPVGDADFDLNFVKWRLIV